MSNDGKDEDELDGKEWYLSKRQGLERSGMGVGILDGEKLLKVTWLIRHPFGAGMVGNCTSQGTPRFAQAKPLSSRVLFDR